MARIRTIKPEFWSSPSVKGADPWARLLFIAMWNWADDAGRGTANLRELAAFAFPHDDDPIAPSVAELPSLLAEIRGRFHVVFYEVDGRRYYEIPTWDKHQRNERRAKSKYPGPDEGVDYDPTPPDQGKPERPHSAAEVPPHNHGSSARNNGSSGPGTGEQGNRGTGEESPAGLPSEVSTDRARDETRRAGQRPTEHPTIAELNATATRHGGYAVVARWALANPGIISSQRRALAKAVDELIAQGAERELLPATLDEVHRPQWRDPVRSLPSAYDRVRRDAHPPPAAPARTNPGPQRIPTTTQRVGAIQALKRGEAS